MRFAQDVHHGLVRVSDAPGLGVTLDYDRLAQLQARQPDAVREQ